MCMWFSATKLLYTHIAIAWKGRWRVGRSCSHRCLHVIRGEGGCARESREDPHTEGSWLCYTLGKSNQVAGEDISETNSSVGQGGSRAIYACSTCVARTTHIYKYTANWSITSLCVCVCV